jgi:DNA-binding transcriptional LysR family regulator
MSDINKQKLRQLDFTLLLVLQGLLRHRRTVEVADDLGLSQPAISHALRRLRDIFAEPLFVRRPHGLEPTRHALTLAAAVDSLIREASLAIGLADEFDPASTRRHYRIGAPEHLSSIIAAPLLNHFQRYAPGARFHLRTDIGEAALRGVLHDQIDVALGQFQGRDARLRYDALYDDEYALVLRRGHSDAPARATRAVLAKLAYVAVSPTGESRPITEGDFRSEGIERNIVATVPRFQTAFEVVRRTNLAVVAPRRLAEFHQRTFRLLVRKLPIAVRSIHVVLVRRNHRDPGLDWLTEGIGLVLR